MYAAGMGKDWDVFVSHASEDKDFARPLAEALHKSGLSVWYDDFTLRVGDSLRRRIDEGLAKSRYGIVILSHAFFAKNWPQAELDGLTSKQIAAQRSCYLSGTALGQTRSGGILRCLPGSWLPNPATASIPWCENSERRWDSTRGPAYNESW